MVVLGTIVPSRLMSEYIIIIRNRWWNAIENKKVGERIAYLRVANHYTREVLAELIGISPKFLYEIETGKKGFSADTLYKISMTLGVSSDYILTGRVRGEGINQGIVELFDESQLRRTEDILQLIHDIAAGDT